MVKIAVVSLGCNKNLVDSEMILGILVKRGYQIVSSEEDADIVIINTCAFIHDAKQESINKIIEVGKLKNESLKLKAENYHIEGVAVQNDSIGYNPYENFKFVVETSRHYEGPVERDVTYISAAWNFVVLFVVLILMVLNKFMSPQRLSSVISMPFQNGSSDRTMRDSQSFFTPVSFSTIISFILMLSLFVQKIFVVYGGNRILHDNFDFFIDVVICICRGHEQVA